MQNRAGEGLPCAVDARSEETASCPGAALTVFVAGRSPRNRKTGPKPAEAASASRRCKRSIQAANRPTSGCSKTAPSVSSTPHWSRSRAASRVASREWPPSMKKSSSTPGCSDSPRMSAKAVATCFSWGVRAGVRACTAKTGAGSALRSILPLALMGSAAISTTADGTMAAGSRVRAWSSRLSARASSVMTTGCGSASLCGTT